jgi:hypothetical protein
MDPIVVLFVFGIRLHLLFFLCFHCFLFSHNLLIIATQSFTGSLEIPHVPTVARIT